MQSVRSDLVDILRDFLISQWPLFLSLLTIRAAKDVGKVREADHFSRSWINIWLRFTLQSYSETESVEQSVGDYYGKYKKIFSNVKYSQYRFLNVRNSCISANIDSQNPQILKTLSISYRVQPRCRATVSTHFSSLSHCPLPPSLAVLLHLSDKQFDQNRHNKWVKCNMKLMD